MLLGEGLENLLGDLMDVELIGPWEPDQIHLERLSEKNPDVILLVNEDSASDRAVAAQIIADFPDYPLMQVTTEDSFVRVYSSESHLSTSADLIETIRKLSRKENHEK
jgi:ABC-type enterochelin transport system substrate-binding protein